MKAKLQRYFTAGENLTQIWNDLHTELDQDEQYVLYVYKRNSRRSLAQNNLYWLWLRMIEDSTGEDKNNLHEFLKRILNPVESKINGVPMILGGSTALLNREQFREYLDKVSRYAAENMDIVLPEPGQMEHHQLADAEHEGSK